MYGNDAAVLRITQDAYEVIQAEQVEHPFYLPDFCDAINYTLPFVFEECEEFHESCFFLRFSNCYSAVNDLCFHVLRLLNEAGSSSGGGGVVSEKLQHLGQMIKITHQLREQNEVNVLKEAKEIESFEKIEDSKERWSKAKSKDSGNERNPKAQSQGRSRSRSM
jgi:hypothetical protein